MLNASDQAETFLTEHEATQQQFDCVADLIKGFEIYSDFWFSYRVALPSKRHCSVGKETGLTSDIIERLNNPLRQRES